MGDFWNDSKTKRKTLEDGFRKATHQGPRLPPPDSASKLVVVPALTPERYGPAPK